MLISLIHSRKARLVEPNAPWIRTTEKIAEAIVKNEDHLLTSVGTLGLELGLVASLRFLSQRSSPPALLEAPPRITVLLPTSRSEHSLGNLVSDSERHLVHCERLERVELLNRDRELVMRPALAIGVAIRRGGTMERLMLERHQSGRAVQIVPPDGSEETRGNARLLDAGVPSVSEGYLQKQAIQAHLPGAGLTEFQPHEFPKGPYLYWHESPLECPILSHYTRACTGAWPGQTHRAYLEDLCAGGAPARRDAMATLEHILKEKTLRPGGRLIRGGTPMVSFTAASPADLVRLHRFRTHLVRWDFAPVGLVFRRDVLEARGVRPVQYRPERDFLTMPVAERPYFQKHAPPDCDYQAEQEWRLLGALDFRDIPIDAIRVVVPVSGAT